MKLKRIFTISLFLLFAITFFCSTSFSKQGTLTGQVIDGFDKVVKDVEVKIKGTEFAVQRLMKTVNTVLNIIPAK